MKVMIAVVRRALDIAAHWPGNRKVGPVLIPPFLAEKHGYVTGTEPSDALIEDLALHFSLTVYHHSCTCRIGAIIVRGCGCWVSASCAWRTRASCPT